MLKAHGEAYPGNSTRVERAILLAAPLSFDHGEITDKGSVNQRAVLQRRNASVNDLYQPMAPPQVLIVA
jgi:feruloyl-CoA synthase